MCTIYGIFVQLVQRLQGVVEGESHLLEGVQCFSPGAGIARGNGVVSDCVYCCPPQFEELLVLLLLFLYFDVMVGV